MEADTQAETKQLAEQTLAIARQPIYNDQMGVFGYELLFRPSPRNTQPLNSASATAHVLTSALLSTGLEQIVYNRKAIINVTRAFIDVMLQVQLPPEKIMLDLPDNIRVDEVLMDNLRELKGAGYELSIGGFHCLRETRLLAIADNFRVDEKKLDAEQLDRLTKFLRRYKNLSLRALKIETLEEYDQYRTRGYELFQGYFLGSPRIHRVRDLSINKLAIMQLLAIVHNLETPIEELEEKIVRDVSLSFKLMKLVNSPFFGVPKEVDSVKRAIVLLGRDEVRKMVSLLALSGVNDQPQGMVEIALMRAKTCELLGKRTGLAADGYFTVGMFSALDVLMEQPIRAIITKLPLSEEITAAILKREGIMGASLSCALAMEKAQWANIRFMELDELDLYSMSVEAMHWTNGVIQRL